MEKLQFKTNINCSGCIAKVTPFLNGDKRISAWSVDTTDPKRILTVETENMASEEVTQLLTRAGFKSEEVPQDR